jgi:1-acyl-sn-glycerol-3-phosphate acyltransferase
MLEVNRILAPLSYLPKPIRVGIVRWTIERFLDIYADLHASGKENLPDGPAIFVSNHLSNTDALVLNRAFRRFGYRQQVFFLAGVKLQDETMTRLGLETVPTVAIRPNSPDREAIREAIRTLQAGDSLFVFPEGGRSRTGSLIEAKPGVILIARKGGVPIVPIGLEGTEKLMAIREGAMGKETLR